MIERFLNYVSVIYYYFTTSHSFSLEKGGFAKEALLYRRYRHSCIALWYTQYKEERREATKVNRLYQWVPRSVGVERWPFNPRVSGSIPGNLKKLFFWMKIHGLTQTHIAFVQVAKQLDRTLGHNECCSAPSPCSVPSCDLCQSHTFTKHKNKP